MTISSVEGAVDTKMNGALISIIIYDCDFDEIGDCFSSIFSQSEIQHFEVIVFDDCTTDGAWDTANDYMLQYPDRITLMRNQRPFGPDWNLTKLRLQLVKGRYYVALSRGRRFDPKAVFQAITQLQSDPRLSHSYIGVIKRLPSSFNHSPHLDVNGCEDPLVSVCVYNYQYGRYLEQCLESVAEQTYQNIEICFSDNASTDGSWDVALKFYRRSGRKMSLARNRLNFGTECNCQNTAYQAEGKYILLLCSDDAIKPDFIRRCVTLLERFPEAAYAMVHRDIMDEQGNVSSEPSFYDRSCLIRGDEQAAVYMMTSVNPSISQVLYRREDFGQGNMGPVLNLRWFGSRLMDFNLCCRSSMIYIKDPLLLNRVHPSSDGSLVSKNLLQCIGEYCLVHQLANIAQDAGHTKASGRLTNAIEKLSNLCLRYCIRFLEQKDEMTAMRYFRLSEAMSLNVVNSAVFHKLKDYWNTSSAERRQSILGSLVSETNLATRAVSYSPPPESIPC